MINLRSTICNIAEVVASTQFKSYDSNICNIVWEEVRHPVDFKVSLQIRTPMVNKLWN